MILNKETVLELLEYHYDRRERLYAFLDSLKPEDLTRSLSAGWGSIRTTLVHCLDAEEFWVQHGLRKGARPAHNPADYPDLQAIRHRAGLVRDQTLAYVATLPADDLGREESITFSSGAVTRFTISKELLHVVTHETHHRGQVLLLARQMGYAPPDLDLIN